MKGRRILNPADRRDTVGEVIAATEAGRPGCHRTAPPPRNRPGTPPRRRSARRSLERAADLFEANRARLMALTVREAGKTIPDAVSELREAVDYLRYYAARRARRIRRPRRCSPVRRVSATPSRCADAASSSACRPGISRWRSSPARSRRRWRRATRCWPSLPSRRRSSPARRSRLLHRGGRPGGGAAACLPGSGSRLGGGAAAPPAARRRRLHRRRRHRAAHQLPARRPRRPDPAAHRRDRRPERHDRGLLGPARAGDARRRRLGLRQRRAALLGPARAVPARRRGRPDHRNDRGRHGRTARSAIRACSPRTSARSSTTTPAASWRPTPGAWTRTARLRLRHADWAATAPTADFFAPRAYEIPSFSVLRRRGVRPDAAHRALPRRRAGRDWRTSSTPPATA